MKSFPDAPRRPKSKESTHMNANQPKKATNSKPDRKKHSKTLQKQKEVKRCAEKDNMAHTSSLSSPKRQDQLALTRQKETEEEVRKMISRVCLSTSEFNNNEKSHDDKFCSLQKAIGSAGYARIQLFPDKQEQPFGCRNIMLDSMDMKDEYLKENKDPAQQLFSSADNMQKGMEKIQQRRMTIQFERQRGQLQCEARTRLSDIERMVERELSMRARALQNDWNKKMAYFSNAKKELINSIEILQLYHQELSAQQSEYEENMRKAEEALTLEANKFLESESARMSKDLQESLGQLALENIQPESAH